MTAATIEAVVYWNIGMLPESLPFATKKEMWKKKFKTTSYSKTSYLALISTIFLPYPQTNLSVPSVNSEIIPQGDGAAVKPAAAGWSVSSGFQLLSQPCASILTLRHCNRAVHTLFVWISSLFPAPFISYSMMSTRVKHSGYSRIKPFFWQFILI